MTERKSEADMDVFELKSGVCPRLAALAAAAIFVFAAACGGKGSSPAKSEVPAKIENAVKEADLATITLSARAVERLGLATAKVQNRTVPRVLRLGGEIMAVPGRRASIAAPAAGMVFAPEGSAFPSAGARFKRGQAVLRLVLLPPGQDPVGARQDLAVKAQRHEVAKAKAERAAKLLADKAESEKASLEAQVELAAAAAALEAARARLALLEGGGQAAAAAGLSSMILAAPVDGVLESLAVSPGQAVPSGGALFELAGLDPVWVRVPVYVGDVAGVDPSRPARIEILGAPASGPPLEGRPVQGPPLGDPEAVSADLFYELRNPAGVFRLGQKVGVALTRSESESRLVVPWSAVLYDAQGGTWVYSAPRPNVYVRLRIDLAFVVDGQAVLSRGPAAGTEVVVTGAAELFGTEFGVGK